MEQRESDDNISSGEDAAQVEWHGTPEVPPSTTADTDSATVVTNTVHVDMAHSGSHRASPAPDDVNEPSGGAAYRIGGGDDDRAVSGDEVDAEVAAALAGAIVDCEGDLDSRGSASALDCGGGGFSDSADRERGLEEDYGERTTSEGVKDVDNPDNAGVESRPAASEPVIYEALTVDAAIGVEDAMTRRALLAGSRAGSETDGHLEHGEGIDHLESNGGDAGAAVGVRMMNPSQGVQADGATAEEEEQEEQVEYAATAAAKAEAATRAADALTLDAQKTTPAINRAPVAAVAAAPVSLVPRSNFGQAPTGFVVINTTILPMQCHTFMSLPVLRAVKSSHLTGGTGSVTNTASGPGEGCWLLSARGLFEALATRLCVHPQSFTLHRGGERVRFQDTIILEVDRTTAAGDSAVSQTLPRDRAEPVWVTLAFTGAAGADTDTGDLGGVATEERHTRDGVGTAAGESTRGVLPAHLASVAGSEVIVRCIHARRVAPELDPETLLEGRRQGISFDELVRRSYTHDRGVAGDTEVTTAVAIVRPAGEDARKPFLGGYRVLQSPSRRLLHASTQLFARDLSYSPFPASKNGVSNASERCSRQTQTLGTSRSCQTMREGCAQTASLARPGAPLVMDTSRYYTVVARPYFSAAALHALRVDKAVVLQKLYRQWHARGVRRDLEDAEAHKQQRAEARQHEEEAAQRARENRDHMRRAAPRTAADFRQLSDEVINWRVAEAARVASDVSLTAAERQSLLLAITKEEMRMLQELGHRRRLTLLEHKDQAFSAQLERAAADRVWGAAGVKVTTRETVRAAELRDLYNGLVNLSTGTSRNNSVPGDGGSEERLDVLLHVKWTVMEFPSSPVSSELIQLIDREADLLNRGRREASLVSLRKRIALLFRQFIEDPTFNPGIAPFTTTAVGRRKARELGLDGTSTINETGTIADHGNGTNSSPYGGYQAANCACCSTQLRTAVLTQKWHRKANTGPNATANGGFGEATGVSDAEDVPTAAFSPAATAQSVSYV